MDPKCRKILCDNNITSSQTYRKAALKFHPDVNKAGLKMKGDVEFKDANSCWTDWQKTNTITNTAGASVVREIDCTSAAGVYPSATASASGSGSGYGSGSRWSYDYERDREEYRREQERFRQESIRKQKEAEAKKKKDQEDEMKRTNESLKQRKLLESKRQSQVNDLYAAEIEKYSFRNIDTKEFGYCRFGRCKLDKNLAEYETKIVNDEFWKGIAEKDRVPIIDFGQLLKSLNYYDVWGGGKVKIGSDFLQAPLRIIRQLKDILELQLKFPKALINDPKLQLPQRLLHTILLTRSEGFTFGGISFGASQEAFLDLYFDSKLGLRDIPPNNWTYQFLKQKHPDLDFILDEYYY